MLAQIDELILGLTGLGSTERFFPGRCGGADLRQVQNTALVGGVWWFGTKDGVWQEDVMLLVLGMV